MTEILIMKVEDGAMSKMEVRALHGSPPFHHMQPEVEA